MTLLSRGPTLEDLIGPPVSVSRPPPLTPSGFYDVERVRCPHPPSRRRPSAAQAAGLRYEKKAKAFLQSQFRAEFIDGPWFAYRSLRDHTRRFCQPDGYIAPEGATVVFEIKLRWCSSAASQLFLYRDVLREIYPRAAFRLVCVTRSFDPAVAHEGRALIVESLPSRRDSAPKDPQLVEVFIWRP